MKNLLLTLSVLLFSLTIIAQTPAMFNYQAVVRDANSDILANTGINLTVEILKTDVNGTVVFSEQHATSTNAYGVVNVKIGSINPLDGIDWSNDLYFVRISVDGTVLGTSQLISVPYALHAKTAENVFSGNYDDLTNTPDMSSYLTDISTRSLGELADVDLNSLSDNQILKYNAGLGKWISIDVAAASESDPVYSASPAFAVTDAGSGMIITSEERTKLNGVEAGAQVNVNPDWNAVSGDAQILNKPSFSSIAISGDYSDLINAPALFDGTWTSLTGKPAFSTVATSGSYNDLTNKPALFDGTWTSLTGKPTFSTVATSGSYSDLINLPTLSTVAGTGNYNDLTNKPITISAAQANAIDANTLKRSYPLADETKLAGIQAGAEVNVNPDWNAVSGDAQIMNKPSLSSVAISGNYNDLSNKPALFDGTWTSLSGKPTFALVANSGNFNDLINKPTTVAGYGITNAMTTSHAANGITSTNISDWNTAYSWGNHAGLYRASTWVPAWTDVTGKPTFATIATSGDYADLSNAPVLSAVATSGNYSDLSGNPDLSTYATKDMSNENISNLANPVNEQDAVTKSYADMKFQMLLNYMVESGADVQGLLDAGISVEELVDAEAPIADLIAGGANVSDLFAMGVCVGTLRKAGALEADLIAAGLAGTLTDFEGNVYGWVKIGNQIWMDENLKSTKYSDGNNIPGYYSYNYDVSNVPVYGYIYNVDGALRNAATSETNPSGVQGACPSGWHMPSDAEWQQLEDFLLNEAYGIDETNLAKSYASNTLWFASATEGNVGNDPASNNDSGFDAIPAGKRNAYAGSFDGMGQYGYFYSSSYWDSEYPYYDKYVKDRNLQYNQSFVGHGDMRYTGYSVRCVKD